MMWYTESITMHPQEVGHMFQSKAAITGGARGIGQGIAARSREEGAAVCIIDTTAAGCSGADAVQKPCGRVGTPADIDGGMTRLMIDHGWRCGP